jgi:hypothetical protein
MVAFDPEVNPKRSGRYNVPVSVMTFLSRAGGERHPAMVQARPRMTNIIKARRQENSIMVNVPPEIK